MAPGSAPGGTALVFELKVKDRGGLTATDTATVTVQAVSQPSTYRIWDNSTVTPATVSQSDSKAVELGMKFRAEVNGYVTGVRFYKSTENTGRHVGKCWSRNGKLLSSVVFSNETASGWQEAPFAAPVVAANATYVISYHTNTGGITPPTKATLPPPPAKNRPARPGQRGENGHGNGVYKYGDRPRSRPRPGLPSNYWVDVVFEDQFAIPPPAPTGFDLQLMGQLRNAEHRGNPHPIPRPWSWA